MIFIIDYRNGQGNILADLDGQLKKVATNHRDGFEALSSVLEFVASHTLQGVVVVIPKKENEDQSKLYTMTWSTIRGAVALANSLAFAWGVPAVSIDSVDDDGLLVKMAHEALRKADPNSRVSASYWGQPNITKPKF